jgi:hypothetical protein
MDVIHSKHETMKKLIISQNLKLVFAFDALFFTIFQNHIKIMGTQYDIDHDGICSR